MLVVEDEFLIALDLEEMLLRHGCRVIGPATSVSDALALLDEEWPEAAIIDIDLRGERVSPVAEVLRARAIPFIVASAFAGDLDGEGPLADAPRLPKPVSERLLLRTLGEQAALQARGRL